MQGFMGTYLERNVQAFLDIQKKLQEQSSALYGDPTKVNEQLWSQFLSFQGPAMQSLMQTYMEQSKAMFQQMQEQLQNQTRTMFAGFGLLPAPGGGKAEAKTEVVEPKPEPKKG
jgi:polyhydroxyalkanoate synthesis regulator protein